MKVNLARRRTDAKVGKERNARALFYFGSLSLKRTFIILMFFIFFSSYFTHLFWFFFPFSLLYLRDLSFLSFQHLVCDQFPCGCYFLVSLALFCYESIQKFAAFFEVNQVNFTAFFGFHNVTILFPDSEQPRELL